MAEPQSSAYALVDKDVTQDADLLVPEINSPSKPYAIAQEKKKPTLLGLPNEIKQNIWTMAVTCDEPITPYQIAPKSNKFLWNAAQVAHRHQSDHNISAVGPLIVVSLTSVCKEMYTDISLTHLFYRSNDFDFHQYSLHFIAYLVAITDERRQAIGSMHFRWDVGSWNKAERCQSMALIASCKSLWSLKMTVYVRYYSSIADPSKFFSKLPEYKFTYAAMQGLKELDLILPTGQTAVDDPYREKLKAALKTFKDNMADTMATERTGKFDLKLFYQAQQDARLDIDGEGRLSDDKKPGIISSRTRSRVAKVNTLTPDGVLPPREVPKYDLDNNLAWYVKSVLDCREGATDDGSTGIEFHLECEVRDGYYIYPNFKGRTETCWEDASAVGLMARSKVVKFYQDNPDKPGISAVYDEWLLQGDLNIEAEDINKRRAKFLRLHHLKDLEVIMRKKVKAEKAKEAEEAKAEKAAAKAEKAAAKAKPARRARGKKA